MIFRFLLCLFFIEFYGTHARTDDEIKEWFFRVGVVCNKDHPITPDELMMLRNYKLAHTTNLRCLVDCIFKTTGVLDSKGLLDTEASMALAEKEYADNPKRKEDSKKLLEACKKVNDQAVPDGNKTCERTALLYKCFLDSAEQLGIKLP